MTEEKVEKKATPKKTLSLGLGGAGIDVVKIAEQRAKTVSKGKTEIEVKGTKKIITEDPVNLAANKSSKKESVESVEEIKSNNTLTNSEKLRRLKVLEDQSSKKEESNDIGAFGIKVVVKESLQPKHVEEPKVEAIDNKKQIPETTIEPEKEVEVYKEFKKSGIDVVVNKSLINKPNPTKAPVGKAAKLEVEEVVEAKPKKPTTGDQKKNQVFTNLRNIDVSLLSKKEEDEDFDDDYEDDVVVEEKKPVFVRRIKRKNSFSAPKAKVFLNIEIAGDASVKFLASKMAQKVFDVVKSLDKLGITATADTMLDQTTIELVVNEFGHKVKFVNQYSVEDDAFTFENNEKDLKRRPPVVTIMGHVDHGKTTLLDTLRKTSVASGEAGGITQHIGAYQVKTPKGDIVTFLDTPGHEAFSQIRSRGSRVTDIILLVVAADDGLKPQTIESIKHAQAADVPMIVVVNKIDKPEKNPAKIKTDLLQHNVVVEEMGGETLVVEVSAKSNIGLDKLLEAISLQAEILDLKTYYNDRAKGSIIEVKVEKGLGYLATVLLDRGMLKLGDYFVCGNTMGRVKMIVNDKGVRLKEAEPFMPVEISGFNSTIEAGDTLIVVKDEAQAKALVDYRVSKIAKTSTQSKDNLESLFMQASQTTKILPVIVKTDTQGSLEAIVSSLGKIVHSEVEVKILLSAVGEITESDISFAKISNAVIFGFNARANTNAKDLAKKEKVEIRYHSIIYKIIDDVKLMLSGLLDPDIVENIIGNALVKQVFKVSNVGNIAGCVVNDGVIRKSAFVRLIRNNIALYDDVLSQLKHFKDDVKEVKSGTECGIAFSNHNDIMAGDIVECYEKTSNKKTVE
jgi:translation initiation factor IF-2